jgi:hypothetical protein
MQALLGESRHHTADSSQFDVSSLFRKTFPESGIGFLPITFLTGSKIDS